MTECGILPRVNAGVSATQLAVRVTWLHNTRAGVSPLTGALAAAPPRLRACPNPPDNHGRSIR